ncbi:hypothetical protein RclHR1_00660003 [Rhizophagus clarus]|uniref:Uncharacterized protein n=1 Tax=Rhizophagus clarus TaxID=94130 RepID=A0A2Z6SJ90_9GLOM|nr:hypothetical protein RclHR1_00660003 [Rhizophagus clarus]
MNSTHDQEIAYTEGCTGIEQLNQLINSTNWTFFYNPTGDHQIYHVTCELLNENNKDFDSLSDHTFYYKLDDKNLYRITCVLISNSLIVQFLNKKIYGIEFKGEQQQEYLTFSNIQRNNLEFHLKEYLLTSKQINKKPNVNVLTDVQPRL